MSRLFSARSASSASSACWASQPSRQRSLVVAMIVERLLHPGSKLAATRLWRHSTLAEQLGVADAGANDLYGALDWLLARQKRIEKKLAARQHRGLGWISALRAPALRWLADEGHLQLSLFDKKNLAEIHSPDYPGERLVACYNPLLAEQRGHKRDELLAASEKEFERIEAEVVRRKRTPLSAAEIGRKAGRVLDRYKMGKHFKTTIDEGEFRWQRRQAGIKREAELDGIYVIRTSEKKADLKAADAVRSYKSLARVERVFRCHEGRGSARAADLSPHAGSRAGAHFFMPAGLLRGVADAPSVGGVAV